ncbi:MAG: HhoA/HhoB/HtrA family serine endopeptidase [Leptolyngbyaceae cyanobacterium MO_188.B28]|nr:HhoA/HhoB/HtrA family serine endopeptidase [Leptolyngbyaceae cyanobacterium MO_188.B28]
MGQRAGNRLILCSLGVMLLIGVSLFCGAESVQAIAPSQMDGASNFVTEVVDKAEPAVVQINVSRTIGYAYDPFSLMAPTERVVRGLGSGFVIDKSGQILTNAHVVDNADVVTVSFQDGRVLEGNVLGADPVTDIAVVQVKARNLPTVALGNSDQVKRGQWAIAIGNPLGLQETVTVGVISGTERSSAAIGIPDKRVGFLQTDAAINPGNSGGPLLNAKGDVIGVNTAIIGGAQGLGFAIPINTAQYVAQQLIATGRMEHPYIGVQMVALTPEIRQQANRFTGGRLQVSADSGILVIGVAPRSPAAKAGLRPGDVVQRINGELVTEADQVQRLVEAAGVGGNLQLECDRSSRTVSLAVRPEQLPSTQ